MVTKLQIMTLQYTDNMQNNISSALSTYYMKPEE